LSDTTMEKQQHARELQTGIMALKLAHRRNQQRLATLKSNDDEARTKTASHWLAPEAQN